ncbi:mannose-1-phosphate guanylyltransferase [Treponema brennaborense]|uniref:Mannose-1-phosphate guanylyltransferase n=1 Tax=Treponema brennaborense (strain DSM 12168 / CIP 105900 / DD5/3) TaxID=906968 RepID=F4LNV2_TREBD|nr:mannose-1-phosphate guanylyltransferase [Treponema brennaborense]AEE16937.1 Mannose-1-phosphate guanylyltransferase [Treponema brennaborense DSM 12168]
MFTDAVILAGGFGERLWPASQPHCPKQFLSLDGGISFLQTSLLRAIALQIPGKIILITRRDLLELAANHCRNLAEHADDAVREKIKRDVLVVAEPSPKHTAAPVMLACRLLEKIAPETDHSIIVLTSDHVISPIDAFVADSQKAYDIARKGNFVCYAIRPTEPATGFGYIKSGEPLAGDGSTFKIAAFKEKPDAQTAQRYLDSGEYWWNSGMFAFTSAFFKAEAKRFVPEMYEAFKALKHSPLPVTGYFNGIPYVERWDGMNEAYERTPAISLDTAIAERTDRACAVKASFSWDDVGSWDAFEKFFTESPSKTAVISSKNCFVYSDIPVALCGVDDLIIVIKNGNALVMKKGSSALVREAAQKITAE